MLTAMAPRDAGRGGRAEVAVDDEEVRLRQRRDHHHELGDVGDHGFALAAQVGARQQRPPRQHFDDQHLVVRAVELAAHAIAADDAELAARGPRAQLRARGVAHQQVAAEGRDDVGIESCRRVAAARVHSV